MREGEDFIAAQLNEWSQNLDMITERFAKNPKIHSYRPASTFYSFFKVDGQEDSLSFAKQLIDEGSLSLTPGCAFGAGVDSWMRMCFAVSEAKLTKALDRLDKVITG